MDLFLHARRIGSHAAAVPVCRFYFFVKVDVFGFKKGGFLAWSERETGSAVNSAAFFVEKDLEMRPIFNTLLFLLPSPAPPI